MLMNRTEDKRHSLRQALGVGRVLQFPGAFSALVATMIERIGFDGVYLSGHATAANLALPDICLTTLTEVVAHTREVARATSLPVLVDIDTGFGPPTSIARAVALVEDAGAAGCQIEDQASPKRCGQLEGATLVDADEMVRRIRSAVRGRHDENFLIIGRTDARTVEGLEAAIDRARAYRKAGADVIFPEALRDAEEFRAFRAAVDGPLLINMTEFGKSPLFGAEEIQALGYSIAIYPISALRLALYAAEEGLQSLKAAGDQKALLGRMMKRERLFDYLHYDSYVSFDRDIERE